ncbi:hypothetical protein [Amycolatopsis oliviviridis]|nr:hypothetical protein [Amycolatopsis oliviviridis]
MRIVSLLPAATDFVATLGLLGSLAGRTHECDWPPGALDDVPVVTSSAIDHDVLSSREISAAVGGEHRGSGLYALNDVFACLTTLGEVLDVPDRASRPSNGSIRSGLPGTGSRSRSKPPAASLC